MEDHKIILSEESTEMFENIIEDMNARGYDAVNIPLLISGIIESESGLLKDYIESMEVDNSDMIDAIETCYGTLNVALSNDSDDDEKKKKESDSSEKKESEKEDSKEDPKESDEKDPIKEAKKLAEKLNPNKEYDSSKWESQVKMEFEFLDFNEKPLTVPLDGDVATLIERMVNLMVEYDVHVIEPSFWVVIMFETKNDYFKNYVKDLYISYYEMRKVFTVEKIFIKRIIPKDLSSFMFVLNETIDARKPCEILKRDEEVDKLWNIMLKKNKRNAVIVGEAGVGKTALVEKITYEIEKKTSPEEFFDYNVISLDVNSLIAGTTFRGDAEQRIMDLIKFLEEKDNVILFIDEVHTILGAGSCFEGEMDLANALKPILARGDTIVIGATTMDEYDKYFKKDAALNRRFEMVVVKEPKACDVYEMIKNKIRVLSKFHGVKITKRMVDYTIMIASCFAFEKKNPDKTLDLIDRAMVSAKRDGKKEVDKETILKNFDIYFKMWDEMSEDQKNQVAYHELGHYIVGKASGRLLDQDYLAVSIMPAEDYIGVTVHEDNDSKVLFANMDYYIDLVASKLGGRAGESRYCDDFTSSASQDLINATDIAFYVVSKLGMGNDKLKNKIYLNTTDKPMFTEKVTNKLNKETDKLIKKAYERAKEILDENADILEVLVPELVEKKIMSEKELDMIWRKVVKKRK